jgi:hypothetical protein
MKKPMPPSAAKSLFPAAQELNKVQALPASQIDVFSAPLTPPDNFMDILSQEFDDIYIDDHVIEARDSGAGTSLPDGMQEFQKLCNKCSNYWRLETLAPVKNLKPDGSPFTKIEEHCIFNDKLFALSDRAVFTCTRFKP